MNEVKKSLISAALVAMAIVAVFGGIVKRNSVDFGPEPATMSLAGLMASADKDVEVPEAAYFEQLADLLKSEYVDEITDTSKLADGAVRGMVLSLQDSYSCFYGRDEMHQYEAAQKGDFQGIGVIARLDYSVVDSAPKGGDPALSIPGLVLSEVLTESSAAKAGLQPGDQVVSVDGHWVINALDIMKFRKLQEAVDAKKISGEVLLKARKEMRLKAEKSFMPLKAMTKLTTGTSGPLTLEIRRAGASKVVTLEKAQWNDDPNRLRFVPGAAEKFKKAVQSGKPLDLRQNASGDYDAMVSCLAAVAGQGAYGALHTKKQGKASPIAIKSGEPLSQSMTILVDKGTAGAAEIFALALKQRGFAKLVGTSAGRPVAVRTYKLPSGAGYSLAIGTWSAGAAK